MSAPVSDQHTSLFFFLPWKRRFYLCRVRLHFPSAKNSLRDAASAAHKWHRKKLGDGNKSSRRDSGLRAAGGGRGGGEGCDCTGRPRGARGRGGTASGLWDRGGCRTRTSRLRCCAGTRCCVRAVGAVPGAAGIPVFAGEPKAERADGSPRCVALPSRLRRFAFGLRHLNAEMLERSREEGRGCLGRVHGRGRDAESSLEFSARGGNAVSRLSFHPVNEDTSGPSG